MLKTHNLTRCVSQLREFRGVAKIQRELSIENIYHHYNVKTMGTKGHLLDLEEGLKDINWHIIGMCETRLPGEKMTALKSGHMRHQSNFDTNHFFLICRTLNTNKRYLTVSYL